MSEQKGLEQTEQKPPESQITSQNPPADKEKEPETESISKYINLEVADRKSVV